MFSSTERSTSRRWISSSFSSSWSVDLEPRRTYSSTKYAEYWMKESVQWKERRENELSVRARRVKNAFEYVCEDTRKFHSVIAHTSKDPESNAELIFLVHFIHYTKWKRIFDSMHLRLVFHWAYAWRHGSKWSNSIGVPIHKVSERSDRRSRFEPETKRVLSFLSDCVCFCVYISLQNFCVIFNNFVFLFHRGNVQCTHSYAPLSSLIFLQPTNAVFKRINK